MIHFTCDVCGKAMSASDHQRYTLEISVRPANPNVELTEEDVDEDNLAKVSQILQQMEAEATNADDPGPISLHFDLCSTCRKRVLKDPFTAKVETDIHFSKN